MSRLGFGLLPGLWIGLALGSGCGGGAPPEGEAARAPLVVTTPAPADQRPAEAAGAQPGVTGAGGRRGVRLDATQQVHHVRALERQPDGTFKNVCADVPGALRPGGARGVGGGAGGGR